VGLDPLRDSEIAKLNPHWRHGDSKDILCIRQCYVRNSQARCSAVKTILQALDPEELSLVGASLADLRVSSWKYFGRFLVVAVY